MRFKTLEFRSRYLITLSRINSLGEVEDKDGRKEEKQECRISESSYSPVHDDRYVRGSNSTKSSEFIVCFWLTIYRRERECGQITKLRMQNDTNKDDTGTDLISPNLR